MALIQMWGTRPIEGIFHFFVLTGLLLHFLDDQQCLNALVHLIWVAALIIGSQTEGLRMPQFLAFKRKMQWKNYLKFLASIPFTLHLLAYVMSSKFYTQTFNAFGPINMLVWLLSMAAWIHSVHFVFLVGANDFCRVKTATEKSLYSVGIKHIKITDKELEATVYYPMDRQSQQEFDAKWFADQARTMKTMKDVFGPMFEIPYIPSFLVRAYTLVTVPMITNGNLCKRFASGQEALRPVIFSHGLSGDKVFYTGVYHALAAHGHFVIAVNHQDESCFHTYDKTGKEILFLKKPFYVAPFRQAQIKIRSDEIMQTISALSNLSHELHFAIFGASAPEAKIDMKELVLSGHSFGGATMIATANQLKDSEQPKALLLLDPWNYAFNEGITSGQVRFRCPVQMLHSEYFHGTIPVKFFDSWGCIQQLLKTGKCQDKQENIIVKRSGHHVQTDFTLVAAWEMCVLHGVAPRSFLSDAYQLHIALMISFLAKIDSEGKGYFDPKFSRKIVSEMEKEWVQYDCKCQTNLQ